MDVIGEIDVKMSINVCNVLISKKNDKTIDKCSLM